MLTVDLESVSGVAQLHPSGPLTEEDFSKAGETIGNYIETHGDLHGLLIHSKSFPGWDSFSALVKHMKFIGSYHDRVKKVAIVTDSPAGAVADKLVDQFVNAKIRQFAYADTALAGRWLMESEGGDDE